jgi:P4 family phage/plasmid primase-like protien
MEKSVNNSSKIIKGVSDYKDVNDFLFQHIIKKRDDNTETVEITNTRIPDKKCLDSKTGHPGGSYNIPDGEYSTFIELYYRDIVSKNKKAYFTEKQRKDNGPILIDLDFRHTYETEERQYTKEDLDNIIKLYLDELNEIFQMDEDTAFTVYVYEKPTVNRIPENEYTKDGIHMIIGLQANHAVQQLLRKRVIRKINNIMPKFPMINTWEDVFDEGISKGGTGWQLYGSRKPGHDRYKLSQVRHITINPDSNDIMNKDIPESKWDMANQIQKMSVRYQSNPMLFMRNSFLDEYNQFNDINANKQQHSPRAMNTQQSDYYAEDINMVANIRNKEELEVMVNNFIEASVENPCDYYLKTLYEYTMILPEPYYGASSYDKWMRVGWVLFNTHKTKLLIVWIAFSAQSSTFCYSNIPDICDKWRKMERRKEGGVTKLSLIHWAKTDAPEAYDRIKLQSLDYYVEQTIHGYSSKERVPDFDLANVLYHMYKHEYVCVSVTKNMWYRYLNNRWEEIDAGTSLRKSISIELRDVYVRKSEMFTASSLTSFALDDVDDNQVEKQKALSLKVLAISKRLGVTGDKKNMMVEARELFYDGSFMEKMDTNPYLLCFNNKVVDFKERCIRKGQPEDVISLCTGIDYIPIDLSIHKPIMNQINNFMDQLFPDKELCNYMWEHLSSTLMGTSSNQTFNMYVGGGSNGKSVLMNLMEKVLGQYKGDVPTTLVTEKRGKVGGLAPEIVQLKGIRYAVMQEPSKTDVINEGIMKQLTSGKDPIQGRAPYMPKTISFIPQFKLAVACNSLMGIKANDHGTWRRIRVVPFKSLFTEKPVDNDEEKPYQFMLDKDIEEKFDEWKEVFAAMLVDRVFETRGVVNDCEIVMSRSNEYRQSQDHMAEFIQDKVVKDKTGFIKQIELKEEFKTWYGDNYDGPTPSIKDLREYMDNAFGRRRNQCWVGVKIKYINDMLPLDIGNDFESTDGDEDECDDININNL